MSHAQLHQKPVISPYGPPAPRGSLVQAQRALPGTCSRAAPCPRAGNTDAVDEPCQLFGCACWNDSLRNSRKVDTRAQQPAGRVERPERDSRAFDSAPQHQPPGNQVLGHQRSARGRHRHPTTASRTMNSEASDSAGLKVTRFFLPDAPVYSQEGVAAPKCPPAQDAAAVGSGAVRADRECVRSLGSPALNGDPTSSHSSAQCMATTLPRPRSAC